MFDGLTIETIGKSLDALEKFGLIGCIPENFVVERGEYQTNPNTYWVHTDKSRFTSKPMNYQKRKFIHVSQCLDDNTTGSL
ncbi:hypothetical protein ACEOWJ_000846 [Bacillus cereus]|uniref:hypothetical protein n=1 Tax=Bacillus TaxID=1386 RepID=UPI0005556FE9|nr:hypothetical protein [Bacillus sp. UNC322MFChir4.1]